MKIIKEVKFKSDAQEAILEGVTIIAKAVASTLGPAGRVVLMDSQHHIGGMTATKDGVTVANSINLDNPAHDIVVRTIREAARKTALLAGDGTSNSIVLAEAIIRITIEKMAGKGNMTEVTRNITTLIDQVIANLEEKSVPLIDDMLYHVATISANNDAELGNMIGKAYQDIGDNGIVVVKNHKDIETKCELSGGIKFDRGYSSAFQITNNKGRLVELMDPLILVTDRKIESLLDISGLIEAIFSAGRSLLIIAELGQEAQGTLNLNIAQNGWKAANVFPPAMGYRQEEMLKDIAAATEALFMSDKMGNNWETLTIADLGTADKVIVDRESTTIIREKDTEEMKSRLEDLQVQRDEAKTEEERKFAEERIANLCGKVATITVGGNTPMEQKERKDRVDDAVLATKAGLEEGALPGGGIALLEQCDMNLPNSSPSMILAAEILSEALKSPFRQILVNADLDPEDILDGFTIGDSMGYNAKTNEYGNMFDLGVIDPAKVTKMALRNGGAVAVTLLMTDTIVTNVRQKNA